MKLLRLFFIMLRVRVALVLVLFYLIGVSASGWFVAPSLRIFAGLVAVVLSYGCATCINDLSGVKADKINLKGAQDRPLANGKANVNDIIIVACLAGLISVICGFLVSFASGMVVICTFVVNITYSLPPFKISHRPALVPFFLPVGYVILPFLCGFYGSGSEASPAPLMLIIGLYCLFISRINLKDFRDRKGDVVAGKKTLLSIVGKKNVIVLSYITLIIGMIFTLLALQMPVILSFAGLLFGIFSSIFLYKLSKSIKLKDELQNIALGARFGNGILFLVLGFLMIDSVNATSQDYILFGLCLIVVYSYLFFLAVWRTEKMHFVMPVKT